MQDVSGREGKCTRYLFDSRSKAVNYAGRQKVSLVERTERCDRLSGEMDGV